MSLAKSAAPAILVLWCALLAAALPASAADDWQPITPEELKMTSEPNAPGAPAVLLYRQVDRDDQDSHEDDYVRIKVFTEEGRKYADVEIPFLKGRDDIRQIEARTVRPDGTITNFDGKIYEKTIVKIRGVKYLAKIFTLPDIRPGSIIEYRYRQDMNPDYVYGSRWILSSELFTKHAKFSLKQNQKFDLVWSWPRGLPPGTGEPKIDHGVVRLETQNVPAFQAEDHMPPENEMKFRVEFVYSRSLEKDVNKFWWDEGNRLNFGIEQFVDKRAPMAGALQQIVAPADSSEIKLEKIYARTQQVRNLSFERRESEQERKREKLKDINNVEDVWKQGYGNHYAINCLFLALARAAGFEAYMVRIPTRDEYFFNPQLMNALELNTDVVLVELDGKDLYFDPGTAFTPYGLLPWKETSVQGRKLDHAGGSWVQTPLPDSSQSRVERKAILKLTDDGSLEGKLTVTFTGLEALGRRLDELEEDDTARTKFLEDEVKECIPVSAEVKLTNQPDWESSSPAMVAEYDIKVPGWSSSAGRRLLVPVGLFGAPEKHMFEHAERVFPVYFHHPFRIEDDITVDLPSGLQVSNLPPAQDVGGKVVRYSLAADNKNGPSHWTRLISLDILQMQTKYYPALQNFYQTVRTGDEQQIVLLPN
jgi:Domain of Unknown Function with PDB structure (DUF3857)